MATPPRDDKSLPPWLLRPDHAPDPMPALDTQRRTPLTREQIDAAIRAFIDAPDFTASRQVLEQQQSVLLNLDTLRRLLALLEHEDRRERRMTLRLHAELLLLSRDRSIDEAWQWLDAYLAARKQEAEEVMQVVLGAMTPTERRDFDQVMHALANERPTPERRQALEQQVRAILARVSQRLDNSDKGAQQGGKDVLITYLEAPGWPRRFTILRERADDLLHSGVIAQAQHLAREVRRQGHTELAGELDECVRVLEDAKARGIDAARQAFDLRHGNAGAGLTMFDDMAQPPSSQGLADPPAPNPIPSQSADPADDAPAMPEVSLAQMEQIRALAQQPGALDEPTRQILLAWLGEGDAEASLADIARALQTTLALLAGR
jgi:hypothetical protein